jgi:hypothetical protein
VTKEKLTRDREAEAAQTMLLEYQKKMEMVENRRNVIAKEEKIIAKKRENVSKSVLQTAIAKAASN